MPVKTKFLIAQGRKIANGIRQKMKALFRISEKPCFSIKPFFIIIPRTMITRLKSPKYFVLKARPQNMADRMSHFFSSFLSQLIIAKTAKKLKKVKPRST